MNTDQHPRNLHRKVAEQLRRDIESSSETHLPSLVELGRRYHASTRTISRALHLLHEQGLVEVVQGRRTAVRGRRPSPGAKPGATSASASSALRDRLAAAIREGTYRTGQSLPKVQYFTLSEHVGENTVCEAFRMLRDDKLVHKRGKRWIVGPRQPGRGVRLRDASLPTVLILVPSYGQWQELFSDHLYPFVSEFRSELTRHRFRSVMVQSDGSAVSRKLFPTGRREILQMIQSLGERFRGVLISSQFALFPDLEQWARWLCQSAAPVVYLDHDNSAPHLDRRRIARRSFYRFCAEEDALVEVAIRNLHRCGHRRILIPRCNKYANALWPGRRIARIEQLAAQCTPTVSVRLLDQQERHWLRWDDTRDDTMVRYVDDSLHAIASKYPAAKANERERLLREKLRSDFPSLAALAQQSDCTAIVALNQWLATNYYCWLTCMGVAVPRRFSIVTFDNAPWFDRYPVSTVDFGLGTLGYSAAHVFIHDIPVRADKHGNLPSRPELVDRGSLQRPA
jgi:DNA-binding GntR family transcriptional regulator